MQKNKKVINAWCMYDWANSVYSLTISSAVFPSYYQGIVANNPQGLVDFFGWQVQSDSIYSYVLSAGFLIVALISPILSGVADYIGNKKPFMKVFVYLGALSCIALYFFTSNNNIEFGLLASMLAVVGFTGSIVFYNAYLPEIAPKEEHDKISAKGFSYGYIGSVILLVINLAMIMGHEMLGITEALAARISFIMVGVWWIAFSQITFAKMPKGVKKEKPKSLVANGFKQLANVWKEFKSIVHLRRFVPAFFFFSVGVQTIIYLATIFGSAKPEDGGLGMETSQLIISILLIQIVAIGGAYLFAYLSKKFGNIKALSICVTVWMLVCGGAYFVIDANGFYITALFVGLVMGGVQSLSRSTYAKMLPKTNDMASYFSFYDVTEKISIVVGTLCFGLIVSLTGSMRNSILAIVAFFVVGLILLLRVKFAPNASTTQF